MTQPRPEQIFLALAAAAAIGAWTWCGTLAAGDTRKIAGTADRTNFAAAPYAPSGRDAPATKTELWPAPRAQAGGAEWVYDVFTPPEIYYDARSKEFSITPPDTTPAPATPSARPFGLELVAVTQPLFRLQLVGYVGDEGNYRGLFENAATTETFLAAGGRQLPELGLAIEDFQVRRKAVPLPESMTTNRRVATAVVRDVRTGETVTLTDGARFYTMAPQATVAAAGDPTLTREVREGETFELSGARYKINKIQLAPPALDVTKEPADQLNSERRTLTPPPAGAPESRTAPAT